MKIKNIKEKNGITLVALVITIIILLILVGVTISATIGVDKLLAHAKAAKAETEKTTKEEEKELTMLLQETNFGNQEYKDINGDIAIIPAGFALTGREGEDIISEGLVITDKNGNEFVWVPVNKENFEKEFVRIAGYSEKNPQDISGYGEADGTGNNALSKESDATKREAIEMYSCVAKNGGFYIGRYEAGKETLTLEDGTTKPKLVIKKGADLYNYIKWGNSVTDDTSGAVEAARKFAIENNYNTEKVCSTLCYSVQWDTAIKFIDPTYTGYAKDSTKQGWFSDNYNSTTGGNLDTNPNHITGKDLVYEDSPTKISNMHKNIYDMGGNAREWVMEACGGLYRTVRGGYYKSTGAKRSASNRTNSSLSDEYEFIGFRVALYVK